MPELVRIGISANFFHRDPDRPVFRHKTLQFLEERMALALQASLLVRSAPAFVADAFCASRLAPQGSFNYGALPRGVDVAAIIERATPRLD